MLHTKRSKSDKPFVETKMGIFTRTGDWFHTTSEHIEAFAPGLLDKVSLKTLIKEAEAWVQSAESLSLIFLYVLLFLINPWLAAAITLIFYSIWFYYKSAFVVRSASGLMRFLNSDIVLFIVAFFSLTLLSYAHHYVAAGIGIVFFFLMKLRLLKRGWDVLKGKSQTNNLPLNDRVLKMVMIRHAMYEDVAPLGIQKMEERFKDLVLSHKKGDQS